MGPELEPSRATIDVARGLYSKIAHMTVLPVEYIPALRSWPTHRNLSGFPLYLFLGAIVNRTIPCW